MKCLEKQALPELELSSHKKEEKPEDKEQPERWKELGGYLVIKRKQIMKIKVAVIWYSYLIKH